MSTFGSNATAKRHGTGDSTSKIKRGLNPHTAVQESPEAFAEGAAPTAALPSLVLLTGSEAATAAAGRNPSI